MDARGEMVQREYLAKARCADGELTRGATYNYSDSDSEEEEGDTSADTNSTPAHQPGPVERKLRAHPPPVGLCFGTYAEGSMGVHILVDRIRLHTSLLRTGGRSWGVRRRRCLGSSSKGRGVR